MKIAQYILFTLIVLGILVVYVFNFTSLKYPTQFVYGESMLPTIKDGENLKYDPDVTPTTGDIIIFDCLVEKCSIKSNLNPEKYLSGMLAKRVIKINEQGCYWVEGDNKSLSWDSRAFGWLCPQDIEIAGVVVE